MTNKASIIIPIILIIAVAVGAFLLLNKNGTQSSVSSTITAASNSTTTLSQSTSIVSTSTDATTCPCLTKTQVQTILNDSAAYKANAIFNINYEGSVASIETTHPNFALVFNSLPANATSSITGGWFLTYNSSANATSEEAFTEQVFESSSNTGGFCTSYAKSISTAGQSPDAHFNQSANGFDYSDINGTLGPYYSLNLVGCKGNYIAIVSLLTGNKGLASTATIAGQISAII